MTAVLVCNNCVRTNISVFVAGFHHSVAVLPLPFRRSAVVKFRCSVKKYVRKFRSVTAVNGKKAAVTVLPLK